MSLAPSLKLTNLGNKFTVNSFFPYLRLTVKIFQFLRLSTKFLAVLRLSVNPIKTLLSQLAVWSGYGTEIAKLEHTSESKRIPVCSGMLQDSVWSKWPRLK